jgi:hypothetical protein
MFAQKLADEIAVDRVDLEALDDFLMSERAPSESIMLSDLDGFLTGIAADPPPFSKRSAANRYSPCRTKSQSDGAKEFAFCNSVFAA